MEISEDTNLSKRKDVVRAVYSPQFLKEYSNNPLIEALPPIFSYEEVFDLLAVTADYSDEERLLEPHLRLHCVQRIFSVFQPLDRHFDLEQRFSMAIRQGYVSRNPFTPDYARRLQQGYESIKQGKIPTKLPFNTRNIASGFTIIGISGIGKSTAINRILSSYPQIIIHSKYKEQPFSLYQISWLKLDCPHDGSTRALCTNFFMAIDRLLGTNYFAKHGSKRNFAVNTMLPIMGQIAQDHCLGALIIDEIQHLSRAKSGGAEEMLNFFVTLVNTIGVPVILIGTNKAMPILQGEFRQARRGSGQGDMVWERMQNDELWEILMEAIWSFQWTKTKTILTQELVDTLYMESQGITDIAVKLYTISQLRAISIGGDEIITPNLIREVSKDSLTLVRPMLDALKSGDLNEIAKYGDIKPLKYEDFYERYKGALAQRLNGQGKPQIITPKNTQSISTQVISELMKLGIAPEIAVKAAQEVMTSIKSDDINAIVIEAFKIALGVSNSTTCKKDKPKAKKHSPIVDVNDLRFIGQQAKANQRPTYEYLNEQGYIKNIVEEFL
ncbi:hypothetical protein SRRS_05070 [Sporomusa rhizae]|uniref:ATP-binding protein n=1 Tax=Sporomusa rhizae TaxID=357999 RepID=UPI00352B9755